MTGTTDPADPLYVHRLIVAALEKYGMGRQQAEQYATAHQRHAAGTEETEYTRRDLDTAEEQAAAHAGKHDPQGTLETIADNRAFIAFARERVISALRSGPSVGEQRLLDAVHRTLTDYESQHEAAALSPTPNEVTGVVDGLRLALAASMWARFSDHPDYRPEWRP